MAKGTQSKLIRFLLFLYFIAFPFGQIIRIGTLHPVDIVVGILVATYFFLNRNTIKFTSAKSFLFYLFVGFIFSLIFFGFSAVPGIYYLIRLAAYVGLGFVVWSLAKSPRFKNLVFNSLVLVSVFVGIFGWIQYFFYPDLRPLIAWGWDDHLYRLVGTFLDPTFTSIILVFGFLLTFARSTHKRHKRGPLAESIGLLVLFLISIAFTYSRAGYLALVGGIIAVMLATHRFKLGIFSILAFLIIIAFLPRPSSEGVQLERTKSVYARLTDYQKTIQLIKRSPLFGVGFNNLCQAKIKFMADVNPNSHSCSGSDSSLLFLIATTGVVGLMFFAKFVMDLASQDGNDIYGASFRGVLVAIFIHSLFSNSLFYAWVMGYLAMLWGISIRKVKD